MKLASVSDPLQSCEARVQIPVDARERDIDDAAIELHDPGSEDRGEQRPTLLRDREHNSVYGLIQLRGVRVSFPAITA
jgi:hypothetical protein